MHGSKPTAHSAIEKQEDGAGISQLYLQEAWWQVLIAEEAIESFKATATRDRKAFAVYLLIDLRKP